MHLSDRSPRARAPRCSRPSCVSFTWDGETEGLAQPAVWLGWDRLGRGWQAPGRSTASRWLRVGPRPRAPLKQAVCDHGCSETVSVNARLLCFSDFVQMLVLRGFQTNSGLRGEAEPERVPQVGEKRSAASGNWGAAGRAPVPWCHCLGASGSGGALSQGGLSRVIPEAGRCACGNRQ